MGCRLRRVERIHERTPAKEGGLVAYETIEHNADCERAFGIGKREGGTDVAGMAKRRPAASITALFRGSDHRAPSP